MLAELVWPAWKGLHFLPVFVLSALDFNYDVHPVERVNKRLFSQNCHWALKVLYFYESVIDSEQYLSNSFLIICLRKRKANGKNGAIQSNTAGA